MSVNALQHSFASGELAPSLFARTDLQKYHSGAALLRNFFVDYRGGVSTRCGTKYVLQAKNSAFPVRVIGFSASFTQTYALEFGQNYLRFHSNGNPVLEAALVITAATQANPCVVTSAAHGYTIGDWVFISGVVGMTQLNGKYYIITATTTNTFTIANLNSVAIDSTGYSAYVSGGTVQRVYTISTPYAASDLALLKFAQNVNVMVLCHPAYQPAILTFINSTNWTITAISFGSSAGIPTNAAAASTLGAGSVNYSYVVTSVDSNGQESGASASAALANKLDIVTNGGTNTITWTAVSGAVFYNIYKAQRSYAGAVPSGASFGFIGFATGTTFIDTNILPDFSASPPIPENPFQGAGIASVAVTATGTYTVVPGVTIAAPSGGSTATASAVLQMTSAALVSGGSGPGGYSVGDIVSYSTISGGPTIVTLVVATVSAGIITSYQPITYPGTYLGAIGSGSAPTNPLIGGARPGRSISTVNITWGVGIVQLISPGAGYTSVPAVTFSAGAATAVATLGSTASGNPSVPGYFDQRLVLAAPTALPQTFYMSQPGSYYNYNVSNPTQADDAITGSIISGQLNTIKSMISMPSGLILLSSRAAWQVNGGQAGSAVSAIDVTANSQAYNGASDVPPIVANYDILYVQSKGAIVRDLSYNFYTNIYTGTDISVLSNHLFFGFSINEWAFAEEPFKIVWAVRSDGILLALTFLKEQEIYGWTHCDTKGQFQSVCSITESTTNGNVDATYFVVQRTINGNIVKYIERMADRFFSYGLEDAWALDAGLQSSGTSPAATLTASSGNLGTGVVFIATGGTPFTAGMVGWVIRMGGGISTITGFTSSSQVTGTTTQPMTAITPDDPANTPFPAASGSWTLWQPFTTFSGLDHLEGQTISALADGVVVTGLVVTNGSVTLPSAATKVVFGLPFTAQLQTMYLDVGEPTAQGKRKQIAALTIRLANSRGLKSGRKFTTLVSIKEAGIPILAPNGLVTADERVTMDPTWDVPGQICIQQNNPYPATILGVIPEITIGDTAK